jgi:hypothetical protein
LAGSRILGICKNVKYAYQEWPHSVSSRSEKEENEREHVFIRILISNKTPQTINEKEKLGVTALERSEAKLFATGCLNKVLECINLTH